MNFPIVDNVYIIAIFSLIYLIISRIIMDKLGNRKKMKEIQDEQKDIQKRMQTALKSKDEKQIEALNKEYETFMPKITQLLMLQFKPMILIFPIIIIMTPWIRSTFSDFVIVLPFYLPIIFQHLDKFPNWRNTFGSVGWFWICVVFMGIAYSLLTKIYEKIKKTTTKQIVVNSDEIKIAENNKIDVNKVNSEPAKKAEKK